MDRLAAYYHWNDHQSFDQAVMVAKSHQIAYAEVEQWSIEEGMIEKYKPFKKTILHTDLFRQVNIDV